MAVKPIPDGYHSITPYLVVPDAPKTIAFLKQAFGATTLFEPMKRPDGSIGHAELKIGDSPLMLSEASEQCPATQAMIHLYVPDVDAMYKKALAAGATSVMEVADQFYGDRSGGVKDPAGNSWYVATHKEDVAPQELAKRAAAFFKQKQGQAA
ncbi:MAG: VOC family protein [Xanthobacteraceae bacterium]